MRIDGDTGYIEGMAQDDVRRFAPYPWQAHQLGERAWDLSSKFGLDLHRQPFDTARLGAEKSRRSNQFFDLQQVGRGEVLNCGIFFEQRGSY